MKKVLFVLVIAALFVLDAQAQKVNGLYVRDTGSTEAPCILFIHGGPGYNCWSFEAAMTDTLLASGYRVITFDQRGSGRSDKADAAEFAFSKALADIDAILKQSKVKRVILIGHSFGGTLALKWARTRPFQVLGLLLIGSPLSYP
ncbi:MAG: alpha/beta fold hydrolase, partial [Candidatus Kapabacteria bacterium]|nr:alpha/beta fold hydrolase [Candidatus Kapabacteria bacterium]